jgi:hypothetical protein
MLGSGWIAMALLFAAADANVTDAVEFNGQTLRVTARVTHRDVEGNALIEARIVSEAGAHCIANPFMQPELPLIGFVRLYDGDRQPLRSISLGTQQDRAALRAERHAITLSGGQAVGRVLRIPCKETGARYARVCFFRSVFSGDDAPLKGFTGELDPKFAELLVLATEEIDLHVAIKREETSEPSSVEYGISCRKRAKIGERTPIWIRVVNHLKQDVCVSPSMRSPLGSSWPRLIATGEDGKELGDGFHSMLRITPRAIQAVRIPPSGIYESSYSFQAGSAPGGSVFYNLLALGKVSFELKGFDVAIVPEDDRSVTVDWPCPEYTMLPIDTRQRAVIEVVR